MVARFDAVVIGAGANGSSAAWWLARSGRSVLLAERFEQGHAHGSSHGAVRIFRFAYDKPEFVRMAQVSLELWHDLEADSGDTLVEQSGSVDHGPRPVIDAIGAALTTCGVPHERLDRAAAGERFTGLRFDDAVVFHPGGGRCFADRAVAAMQRRAADHGADVRFAVPSRIVAVRPDGAEIDVGGEPIIAGTVVVTAGAWAADVLAAADVGPLPSLVVTNEHVVHFPPRTSHASWPSFLHHGVPGERVHYGLPSIGEGVKVGIHHDGPVTSGDGRSFDLDDERVARIVEYTSHWIPGVEPAPQHATTCLYTTTPDERFVIERRGRVVIGSACSGHGFKFAPLTGRELARLATVD